VKNAWIMRLKKKILTLNVALKYIGQTFLLNFRVLFRGQHQTDSL